ncbi:MAG TPA: enoyl-CoA hydratase/isomerase family protein [Ktedonobacteraceae bacterium]|nr:enoyl-CoA hydratase/isomerase family protein [Ktedonobacteraceae bacterium]
MPTLELETMHCTIEGPLARLHLNRPEVLNAANWTWVQDLVRATNYLAQEDQIRVLIVSGEGRAFCSGLDVKELAQGNLSVEWFETWERGVIALTNLPVISIASIQGYCLGGGLQVAIACDLLVASTDAIFSIPAVKEGVVADLGPMRLARLIGTAHAKYLCLLGRRFSAEEGRALGLIHEVVAPEALRQHTLNMAHELLAIPFTALKQTKRQIDRAFEADTATLMDEMVAAQQECLQSPEHAEVMATYREEQAQRLQTKKAAQ